MGGTRLRVLSRLGEGGHGIVYEAFDEVLETRVAVKVLRKLAPRAILRFKQEFRTLVELHHPNLVRLGELIESDGRWYFTMDLVEGVDLLRYVRGVDQDGTLSLDTMRPLEPSYDEGRVRRAFSELAQGLEFLHGAGKIHRDVKPGNVRVTPEGRVVLLDFGLVTEADGERQSTGERIVGTAAYMAPEQAGALAVGPAADCYSVGVMLFEALAGQLPVSGGAIQMLVAKQALDPPPVGSLAPGVPPYLEGLCRDLLSRDPSSRPSAADVRRRLAEVETPPAYVFLPGEWDARDARDVPMSAPPSFVGRDAELAALQGALAQSLGGKLARVRIAGESGTGKTSLARAFVDRLARDRPDAMILSGRCHEQETVPYNAFDAAIDALSDHLTRLPAAACTALVPRRASLLPLLFPVLGKVPALAAAPAVSGGGDALSVRARAFGALRELLHRIAERGPCVLLLDDVQWADAESLALLDEVVRGADAPPILVIAILWALEDCPEDVRASVARAMGDEATVIDVGALPDEPSRALARNLADDVAALAAGTRELLDLVALAGAPLPESALGRASGLSRRDLRAALSDLRRARLARVRRSGSDPTFEPYQRRVRAWAVDRLESPARARLHLALAEALEGDGAADPELLATHWALSGHADRSARYVVLAAQAADRVLAFHRAARLYRQALGLKGEIDRDERRPLLVQLAKALANSGRDAEAAEVYLEATGGAPPAEALDLRRLSATHFLRAGHVEPGLRVAGELLAAVGIRLPEKPTGSLVELLRQRSLLGLRGLVFTERKEEDVAPDALARCDLLWSVAFSLSTVDQVRGAILHARAARASLDLGEPHRVARTLVYEGMFGSVRDDRSGFRSRGVLAKAEAMARRLGDPYLLAYVKLAWAFLHVSLGEPLDCLAQAEDSARIFQEECSSAAWELSNAQIASLSARFHLGLLRGLEERYDAAVREADERGNVYGVTSLVALNRCAVDVVADRPDECEERIAAAMARWPEGPYVQRAFAVGANVTLDLYRGGPAAHARIEREWRSLERGHMLRPKRARTLFVASRGFAALAAIVAPGSQVAPARSLLRLVERCAVRLDREHVPDATAMADVLRAQACVVRGDLEGAERFYRRALRACDVLGLSLGRAVAERLGVLVGGDEGSALRAASAAWAEAEGIRRPDRFFAMHAPVALHGILPAAS